ncbi:MAG: 2'-5' RNA ligase family protein, partial [Pseudomonadota bacterium]|nr:2'-5' RNA ligase family protein [Pseudomonadota bacterium]
MERAADDLQIRAGAADARHAAPARLHLTLRFLGEFQPVSDALLRAAEGAGGEAAAAVEPFELTLDCAGAFGGPSQWLWWLGCTRVPPRLSLLLAGLEKGLKVRNASTGQVQPFCPHVTIARRA